MPGQRLSIGRAGVQGKGILPYFNLRWIVSNIWQ